MRLPLAMLFFAAGASAQTANTDCYQHGNRVSCQTIKVPEYPQQQVAEPNIVDSFLKGREARLRHDQMELQNELLRQQIESSRRAESERNEMLRTEALSGAQAVQEKTMRQMHGDSDQEATLDYWRQQVEACIRIANRHPESKADDCVDNLLVTDPEFARAHAVARRNREEFSRTFAEPVIAAGRQEKQVLAPVESRDTCTPARIRLGSCRAVRDP